MKRGLVNIVKANGIKIHDRIKLEEAVFRTKLPGSWCILGKCEEEDPTVVMGISGKAEAHLNTDLIKKDKIPVLRRFTGGGTVIVNKSTLYVSFIVDSESLLPKVKVHPREIMRWSEEFYHPVFDKLCGMDSGFHLEDTDYVFGSRKFGGNAQGISGKRWIHHTSFLWDYNMNEMDYLSNPEKQPEYRKRRSHSEFLCCLKDKVKPNTQPEAFFTNVISQLEMHFDTRSYDLELAQDLQQLPHRKKTDWVVVE
mmetsp:Transcript_19964/g.25916  ORF Transcript_19964/g.25916 Transcript_19964/m.25916 type:complete len:253 (-) Transcript_19964:969-1727(-)